MLIPDFFLLASLFYQIVESNDPSDSTFDYSQFGGGATYSTSLNAANRLYQELFRKRLYFKDVAPINGLATEDSTVEQRLPVTIKLQLIAVINLDAAREILQAYLELELVWRDLRLGWNPSEFDGLTQLWIQCDSIWVPDDFVVNINFIWELNPARFKQCLLHANGTVVFDEPLTGDFQCGVNMAKFPFDTQECPIQFASPYSAYQIGARGELFTKYPAEKDVAIGNEEVNVNNVIMHYANLNDTDPTGDAGGMIYMVHLKRKPNFYIYVITIPCFLLTFLSVSGCFWTANLKEEQLAKLSIALTSMMSMTTFVEMLSQQIPKTNRFPILGTFVLASVAIISVACFVVVGLPEEKTKKSGETKMKIRSRLTRFFFSRHFALLFLFQSANVINLVIFLSFWD